MCVYCRAVAISHGRGGSESLVHCVSEAVRESRPDEEIEAMLKRSTRPAEGTTSPPVDEATVKRYPVLVEFMTQESWEDGSPRELASVLLVREDGRWKAGLLDKAEERTLWVTAEALAGLLEALERRAAKPDADWRQMRSAKGRKR